MAEPPTFWLPLPLRPDSLGGRGSHYLFGVGRLRPGATVARVNAELAAVAAGWERDGLVRKDSHFGAFAIPMTQHVLGDVRPTLLVLLAAVAFVLLIACANVASLTLARSSARRREVAVRASLGAARMRIVSQLLTENLMLALVGGALGIGFAWAGLRLLVALDAAALPRLADARVDAVVLVFTAFVAMLTGVLFGLAPALQLSRTNLTSELREGSRGTTAGRSRLRFRRGLVASELALSVVLVIGASLMVRSLRALQRIPLGFDPDHVLTVRMSLPPAEFASDADVARFYDQLVHRVGALPGVRSAGAVRVLPLARTIGDWSIEIEGYQAAPNENPNGRWQVVTPGYFETMGVKLLAGRFINDGDRADALPVVVINHTMAEAYWPHQDPLGKRFRFPGRDVWSTVVGVVQDERNNGVTEAPRTEMYHPHDQYRLAPGFSPREMTLLLKTTGDPLGMAAQVRREIQALDASLPVSDVRSMEQVAAGALSQPTFTSALLGIFASVALLLAAIGIYGVVSHGVAQRRQEIGLRMALGADRASVLRMIVTQDALTTGIGIASGIIAALFLTRFMQSLLYGVGRLDPLTFVSVPLLLVLVCLLASIVPAGRATAVDPQTVLNS